MTAIDNGYRQQLLTTAFHDGYRQQLKDREGVLVRWSMARGLRRREDGDGAWHKEGGGAGQLLTPAIDNGNRQRLLKMAVNDGNQRPHGDGEGVLVIVKTS